MPVVGLGIRGGPLRKSGSFVATLFVYRGSPHYADYGNEKKNHVTHKGPFTNYVVNILAFF